jgi:hypothetical protein
MTKYKATPGIPPNTKTRENSPKIDDIMIDRIMENKNTEMLKIQTFERKLGILNLIRVNFNLPEVSSR